VGEKLALLAKEFDSKKSQRAKKIAQWIKKNDQRILFSVGRFCIRWKQKLLEICSKFDDLTA
jgi:hypothetical protein